ncbi:AraC family transcriptional regulator [Parabacteroides sp. 52]|uniref:helix-turn-helix domain-containing protein n=1 Tax=unclassified Parabacteroides TaxID=2649774 RepID=UPI0013D26A21|nr:MULTISPECIES: AraC family transcriptional regulator [unclassified Parabacteroides]MDH6534723.1 AraC-like DNA-binding protein [Parabacteroides sp. PM5-20]NDV55731.1 AraC family transcriptional regulator [Parabacteroides sp. 52]
MNNVLYTAENQACSTNKQETNFFIEVKRRPSITEWTDTIQATEVMIILEGNMHISFDFTLHKELHAGNMMLFAPGTRFKAETKKGVSILVLRIRENFRLCSHFSLNQLKEVAVSAEEKPASLCVKQVLQTYIQGLTANLKGSLLCTEYMKLKTEEFFLLLRAYYTKEELAAFFYPILHESSSFTEFILQNYRKVKKVNEFAQLYACSLSNFDTKFKKAFGVSAYKWMKKKRVELIYHEINTTQKAFRQIAEEQGFLSLPQFSDFCKKNLGDSPGRIRKRVSTFHKKDTNS